MEEVSIHMKRGGHEGPKYHMTQITVTPHLFLIEVYQSHLSSTQVGT